MKELVIVIILIVTLVSLYILYRWEYIAPPSQRYTPPMNAWGEPKVTGPCKLYEYPIIQTSNGIWTVEKTIEVQDMEGLPLPKDKCVLSTQLVLQPVVRECLSDTCKLPDGSVATTWNTYQGCKDYSKTCPQVQASLSLSIPNQCTQAQRCIQGTSLVTCDPNKTLFTYLWKNNNISFFSIQEQKYLATDGNNVTYQEDIFMWSLRTQNSITYLYDTISKNIVMSYDGKSLTVANYDYVLAQANGYWVNFQYLEIPIYSYLLKQGACPCQGCLAILPTTKNT